MEGVVYGVSVKTVSQPVEFGDDANIGSPKKTLVPKATGTVFQLIPLRGAVAKGINRTAKSLARGHELVLLYKQSGKFYYNTLPKLENLDSGSLQ